MVEGAKPGLNLLFCFLPNYLGYQPARYFRVDKTGITKLEARLWPMPKITGRVIDGSGNPVPGAIVASSPAGGGLTKTELKEGSN
jgi:hypothetical protein